MMPLTLYPLVHEKDKVLMVLVRLKTLLWPQCCNELGAVHAE